LKLHIREQQPTPPHHHRTQRHSSSPERPHGRHSLDARNHYPQIKHHTPPPKQGDNQSPRPAGLSTPTQQQGHGLVVSKPNSVSDDPAPATPPTTTSCCAPEPHPLQAQPIQRIA
jgi:hypothetical protein